MEITIDIEIGTDEQKKLISNEISYLFSIYFNKYPANNYLEKVLIPSNFDEKVGQLTSTVYNSTRIDNKELAVAKIIYNECSSIIVISPILFTEFHNTETRAFIYFHELSHFTSGKYKCEEIFNLKEKKIISEINHYYDEYRANRLSFLVNNINESKSELLIDLYRNGINGFIKNLNGEASFQKRIKENIIMFKTYQIDIGQFVDQTFPIINSYILALINLFSYIDSNLECVSSEIEFAKKSILNIDLSSEVIELEKYYKAHFESDNTKWIDFSKANLYENVLNSLGISLTNTEEGLYIGVEFI